ncbi:MAG: response regulator transcription factor [Erysipelotrichales bacterium]
MVNVLLLTKDSDYIEFASAYVENKDYNLIVAQSLQDALTILDEEKVKLVMCDVSFGSISVVQVHELFKKKNEDIIVVALGDCFGDFSLSSFLDAGILEFICKKADLRLTEQRMINLLKINERGNNAQNALLLKSDNENLKINIEQSTIYHNGKAIHVTQLEFNLLTLFLQNKNVLLKREYIIENIWNEEVKETNLRKVDSFVKKLRQKLDLESIKSVRGLGYKWIE